MREDYSPVIADSLLDGVTEWRAVQDVIRLTFRALTDVVRAQGGSLNELEHQLPHCLKKEELDYAMSFKANASDLARAAAELRNSLESKLNLDDVYEVIDDKVTKAELYQGLQSRVTLDDFRAALDSKADLREVQAELRALRGAFEELQTDVYRRCSGLATARDLAQLERAVESKAAASEMNEKLQDKADKQSVANALHRKANRVDVEAALGHKMNIEDLAEVTDSLNRKADAGDLERLEREVDNRIAKKTDKSEVASIVEARTAQLNDKTEIYNLFSLQKKETDACFREFEQKLHEGNTQLREFQNSLAGILSKKSDYIDLEKVLQAVAAKADKDSLLTLSNDTTRELHSLHSSLQHEIKQSEDKTGYLINCLNTPKDPDPAILSQLSSLNSQLDHAKADLLTQLEWHSKNFSELLYNQELDLKRLIGLKPSTDEVHSILDQNSTKILFQETGVLRRELETLRSDLQEPLPLDPSSKDQLEFLHRELLQKASIKDICALLDMKANIEEVNDALHALHREIDLKAPLAELNTQAQEQATINETLCAETCLGRWIWKSGKVAQNAAIPWEVQSVNTCPDNFIWEQGKTSLLCVAPGLYEVLFGVYGHCQAAVSLLINGETVLWGPLKKQVGTHLSGNIVGTSGIDFIALPAGARVALTATGGPGLEGFIGLRKL